MKIEKPVAPLSLTVQSVQNGWIVRDYAPMEGAEGRERLVFTTPGQLALAIFHFARGESLSTPVLSGTGVPGDPVTSIPPLGVLLESLEAP